MHCKLHLVGYQPRGELAPRPETMTDCERECNNECCITCALPMACFKFWEADDMTQHARL